MIRHCAVSVPLAAAAADGAQTLRIAYLDCAPEGGVAEKGVIVLLHGFPETSLQFRASLPLFAAAGYRAIAPDYRGAGHSSNPADVRDFRKTTLAGDVVALLDALGVRCPVHVVGHDIGGMIAYALASRYGGNRVRSVCWGECPLPGTAAYRHDCADPSRLRAQFHFVFHCAPDGLAEALVAGRERTYLTHFYTKLAYNLAAFPASVVDAYVAAYSRPQALSCAFGVYRAFEADAAENRAWLAEHGRLAVPSLALSGQHSYHKDAAEAMMREVTADEAVEVGVVEGAGHYLTEENPEGFARAVLDFVGRFD